MRKLKYSEHLRRIGKVDIAKLVWFLLRFEKLLEVAMFVSCIDKIEAKPIDGNGAKNVLKRILIGPKEGWDSHVMRLFTIGKGGNTPRHKHPWPHINYVVSGKGILYMDGKEYEVEKDYVAYVPSNVEHQYINTSDEDFVIICIVPKEGEKL